MFLDAIADGNALALIDSFLGEVTNFEGIGRVCSVFHIIRFGGVMHLEVVCQG